MTEPLSVIDAAHEAFLTAPAAEKAQAARRVAALWASGQMCLAPRQRTRYQTLADRPARPARPELRDPRDMPRRKAGSRRKRQALLHAIAHIELNAIDLALDMVARFGAAMPRAFTDDWLSIAADEARHYQLLSDRLTALGCAYGDLPAHDGLWQAAYATRHCLDARLAVIPMVLEARGLDVTPAMIKRLEAADDQDSAAVLTIIYQEEIRHVAIGTKWFNIRAKEQGRQAETYFQHLVTTWFRGSLKRPFNTAARDRANFPATYYEPLAS